MKSDNKFHKYISFAIGLSNEDIFKFSNIVYTERETESGTEKKFLMEKK